MRLATFDVDGATRIGALLGDAAVPLQAALDAARAAAEEPPERLPETMTALLAAGEAALVAAGRALAFAGRPDQAALRRPLSSVALRAPLVPGKIIGGLSGIAVAHVGFATFFAASSTIGIPVALLCLLVWMHQRHVARIEPLPASVSS